MEHESLVTTHSPQEEIDDLKSLTAPPLQSNTLHYKAIQVVLQLKNPKANQKGEILKKNMNLAFLFSLTVVEPTSYEEATQTIEWNLSMKRKLQPLKEITHELVDLPQDKKSIGFKLIFKTKLNADGSIHKYKARLVAKGYAQ